MNANTREDLIDFIEAVEQLAFSVSTHVSTDTVKALFARAETLKKHLRSDETIL